MTDYHASISWQRDGAKFTDNRYRRLHTWTFDEGLDVPASASPNSVPLPYSEARAVDPEEALVAAVSSCHMLWFLSIAAKRDFVVERYADNPVGTLGRNAKGKEAITVIKALVEGRTVAFEGTDLELRWSGKWTLPVWVAGYGPMALSMAGRVADGLILQLADPDLIRWFVDQVREAAGAAGRAPDSILIQSAAAAFIGPRDVGRERTRWFPALVSNHVVDLVNKYPREQLPASLTGYIRDRGGYDYLHHAEVGSSNAAFVGDDVTDRFCVLGTADEHVAKLHELAAAGVDQFNIYLMNGDEEGQLEAYGRDVIPAFV